MKYNVLTIVYLGDQTDGQYNKKRTHQLMTCDNERPYSLAISGLEVDEAALQSCETLEALHLVRDLAVCTRLADISTLSETRLVRDFDKVGSKSTCVEDFIRQKRDRMKLVEALRKFMHAPYTPWWSRTWVLQEAAVPGDVDMMYGTFSAPWSMFADAASKYK